MNASIELSTPKEGVDKRVEYPILIARSRVVPGNIRRDPRIEEKANRGKIGTEKVRLLNDRTEIRQGGKQVAHGEEDGQVLLCSCVIRDGRELLHGLGQ